MADLVTRITNRQAASMGVRNSIDWWLANMLVPAMTQFTYGGHAYQVTGLQQTLLGARVREVANTLPGYMAAFRACPPAFAAQMLRAFILSQVSFTFRNRPWTPTPRRKFTTSALELLETPWPNGTTGELVSRMEWHEGLTGNAYVVYQATKRSDITTQARLRVLRPDWVGVLYGSERDKEDPMLAIDGEIVGYVYSPGGFMAQEKVETFLPGELAHWKPLPDPESPGIGMSWATPGLRDMQADRMMTEHKIKFFELGATPNLVVKGITAANLEKFTEIVNKMEEKHRGLANAYRTMYLTAGADVEVVGSDMKALDFATVQGRGETRIAMLSRVPASILQISEGLQGSALNAGNWAPARRTLADTWVYPTMMDLAATLAVVTPVPADAQLWFDDADMPILREDAKDAAEIANTDAVTIGNLIKDGYKPDSAVAAVMARDMSLLKGQHTGLVSVQLQPPGTSFTPTPTAPTLPTKIGQPKLPAPGGAPAPPAGAKSQDDAQ